MRTLRSWLTFSSASGREHSTLSATLGQGQIVHARLNPSSPVASSSFFAFWPIDVCWLLPPPLTARASEAVTRQRARRPTRCARCCVCYFTAGGNAAARRRGASRRHTWRADGFCSARQRGRKLTFFAHSNRRSTVSATGAAPTAALFPHDDCLEVLVSKVTHRRKSLFPGSLP